MAIRGAVRWKPDTYRSSLNTTIQDFDPAATPPTGQVVMIAQAVAYEDTEFASTPYRPGDPTTERKLVVLYEEPISRELSAFDAMTNAEAAAAWAADLEDFKNRILPVGPLLVRAIRAARIADPVVI